MQREAQLLVQNKRTELEVIAAALSSLVCPSSSGYEQTLKADYERQLREKDDAAALLKRELQNAANIRDEVSCCC